MTAPPSSPAARSKHLPWFARAAAAALLFGLLASGDALARVMIYAGAKVSFFAELNPGTARIEGVTDQLTLEDDGTTLTFTVPMRSVTTGIELRDKHMNEKYAETGTYPNVRLAVPRASLQWPVKRKEPKTGTTNAAFTAHGVTADVPVTYDIRKTKDGYSVNAKFTFDTEQHNIAIPEYFGITVDPKMRAEANFELKDDER